MCLIMKDLKVTNSLLLIIVVPLVFYLLKILSFIFIPLIMSMFIALLFLPMMRWLNGKRVPKPLGIALVIFIIIGALKIGGELIQLSSNEILAAKDVFIPKAESKLIDLVVNLEAFFGIDRVEGESLIKHYIGDDYSLKNFGSTFDFIRSTLTMTLMTVFFVILLLSESINFQHLLNTTVLKRTYSSVKTFMKIEKDILKFVKVKFVISLFTGVGFSIACVLFDVSFPIFWGLFAFVINFVQMVGSVVSVVLLTLFAFVELDPTGTLLFFIICITGVQVLMGGILEPVFMGKTFSLNVVTVLIMLMLWGYIWGIPGMVMSIPITVFIKIIMEQFESTKLIAVLMSGSGASMRIGFRKSGNKA